MLIWNKDFPNEKKVLWHTTIVAGFCPLMMVKTASTELYKIYQWKSQYPLQNMMSDYKASAAIFYLIGLSCGYMLFDTLCMIVFSKPLIKAMRAPLFLQMILHHLASLILFPYALCSGVSVVYIVFNAFTEITNPCLNLRWILENHPSTSGTRLNRFMNIAFVLVFFVLRMIPLPFLLVNCFLPWNHVSLTWFQSFIVIFFLPVPFYLNAFWFSLMWKKIARTFGFAPTKKDQEKKKK